MGWIYLIEVVSAIVSTIALKPRMIEKIRSVELIGLVRSLSLAIHIASIVSVVSTTLISTRSSRLIGRLIDLLSIVNYIGRSLKRC